MRKAIRVPALNEEQLAALEQLCQKTDLPRVRTRAQMVLLSAQRGLKAAEIAANMRERAATVRCWLKRYMAEGPEGLFDVHRSGRRPVVTEEFRKQLLESVHRSPSSLGLPYSRWTLQRLADYMAEKAGIRFSAVTIRQALMKEEIIFGHPQHTITSSDPDYRPEDQSIE